MIVTGLITEYNPFHFGHKLHLKKSIELGNSTHTIAIMSGDFVQRGEPAIVNKWTRANMAIEQGVDLVIELPTIFACQSAEYFAAGAMRLLDKLSIVNNFCFGSEAGSLEDLSCISKILVDNPLEFQNLLKKFLDHGNSFPVARSKALVSYSKNDNWGDILNNSNNILGIEYLKSKYKYNIDIEPLTIQRKGASYNDLDLNHTIASATAIRNKIFKDGLDSVSNYVPESTKTLLEIFQKDFGNFNRLNNYTQILNYNIASNFNHIKELPNFEIGLDFRIKKASAQILPIENVISLIKTKRYTYTRIQRLLIHSLLNISDSKFHNLFDLGPQYIRPLASNKKGLELLSLIKKNSSLPIISKFANFTKNNAALHYESLMLDKLASDIFYLGLPSSPNAQFDFDFYKSFKIK